MYLQIVSGGHNRPSMRQAQNGLIWPLLKGKRQLRNISLPGLLGDSGVLPPPVFQAVNQKLISIAKNCQWAHTLCTFFYELALEVGQLQHCRAALP